ncbi:MAG TPA: Zeta toxin family protein [bacterium]|nr:Zeta toxin family protein [bacterium]
MKAKNVYVIAGPNGSGKTTFAMEFLPDFAKCPNFINADLIAKGLSPFGPEQAALKAGKLVLRQISEYAEKGEAFAFETTLSGKAYYNLLKGLKEAGYGLHLFFLWIPSPALSIARIKDRVAQGGHNVPAGDVRRRFGRGIRNFFELYEGIFNTWLFFDNSGPAPKLIAESKNGELKIVQAELFEKVQSQGGVQ